jgi:YHS domain-containing protein
MLNERHSMCGVSARRAMYGPVNYNMAAGFAGQAASTMRKTAMLTRRMFAAAAIAAPIAAAMIAPAAAGKPEIFTGLVKGKGAAGHDVVAYFTMGKPVKGKAEFSTSWKGATWEFSSAENLEKFKANPEAYAPQYGGYCAYGVSKGGLVKGEPDQWTIVDGKLYLNYSAGVQKTWSKDIPGFIATADKKWPNILN